MKSRTFFFLFFLLLPASWVFTGCSARMATQQPVKRNLEVLAPGTFRSRVVAELGRPVLSDMRNGRKFDVFKFQQGYGTATRSGRALMHGLASTATLGAWEIIGTPAEGALDGKEIQVEVTYDEMDRISYVETYAGNKKLKKILKGQDSWGVPIPPPPARQTAGDPAFAADPFSAPVY